MESREHEHQLSSAAAPRTSHQHSSALKFFFALKVTRICESAGPKGQRQGRAHRGQDVTSKNVARSPRTSLCSVNKAHLFPTAAGSPTSGKEQDTTVGKALSSTIIRAWRTNTKFCPSDADFFSHMKRLCVP